MVRALIPAPMAIHPPCGLYRTTRPLGELPAGRLVYFHNHGDPGPGVYLPNAWQTNRARWHEKGHTVPDAEWSQSLTPLPREGLYRVREAFFCCPQRCHEFPPGALVQLGYTGDAEALLFTPGWTPTGLEFPERGTRVDAARLASLDWLEVPTARSDAAALPGGLLH